MRTISLSIGLLILSACTVSTRAPVAGTGVTVGSSASHVAIAWNEIQVLQNLPKTDSEWKAKLTPEQYDVLRQEGTEVPFTSPLLDEHRAGTFVTADCGEPVFRSEQKFDSGTGWPSFWAPISPDAVVQVSDGSYGMDRTEVKSKCGGHLGHVFTDGPQPTGLRYCMNGVALKFIPDEGQ